MKIREIISTLESFASPHLQENYDNSGLITGDPDVECRGILVCLDCTADIVREAIEKKCNLIVSHHPLIFRPIRRISTDEDSGKALVKAIRAEIVIYAMHTNLDNIISGVNGRIADRLGMTERQILLPRGDNPAFGSGLTGTLKSTVSEARFLQVLKDQFGTPVIRHSPLNGNGVSRVSVCGGAGSFLISNALENGSHFFVTADVKYHDFFQAEGKMIIADIGHFESEQFTIDLIHDIILEKFRNFAVLKSGIRTNPVHYYI